MRFSIASARCLVIAVAIVAVVIGPGLDLALAQGAPNPPSQAAQTPATAPAATSSGCELRLAPKPQMSSLTPDSALLATSLKKGGGQFTGFCPCGCSFIPDCNTSADCFGGATCYAAPSCC